MCRVSSSALCPFFDHSILTPPRATETCNFDVLFSYLTCGNVSFAPASTMHLRTAAHCSLVLCRSTTSVRSKVEPHAATRPLTTLCPTRLRPRQGPPPASLGQDGDGPRDHVLRHRPEGRARSRPCRGGVQVPHGQIRGLAKHDDHPTAGILCSRFEHSPTVVFSARA